MVRRNDPTVVVRSMETGEVLRIETTPKKLPKKRPKRRHHRRRGEHRHIWRYEGRAGIFDPSKVYICEVCSRRMVRKPRKPRKKPPLAQ